MEEQNKNHPWSRDKKKKGPRWFHKWEQISIASLRRKETFIIMIHTYENANPGILLVTQGKYWMKLVEIVRGYRFGWAIDAYTAYGLAMKFTYSFACVALIDEAIYHVMKWSYNLQNRTPPEISLICVCLYSITFAFIGRKAVTAFHNIVDLKSTQSLAKYLLARVVLSILHWPIRTHGVTVPET